jgi:hypothetical protein
MGAQEYTWRTLAAGFRLGMGQYIPDRMFWSREPDDDGDDDSNNNSDSGGEPDTESSDKSSSEGRTQ